MTAKKVLVTPGELLHEIVDRAAMDRALHSPRSIRQPGWFIDRLSDQEREVISELKSSDTDTNDTRLGYLCAWGRRK